MSNTNSIKKKELPPYETRYNDLVGVVSINLDNNMDDFNEFASALFHYNPERFKAVALKVFIENNPIVTLYALDLERQKKHPEREKLPVHKFKFQMSLDQLFSKLKRFNFTVTAGNYSIEKMEVINK
ncbi:MAG: hypothetical protein H0V01_09445 [Bacteroidetes bacterium]|nr:hypothetical protein [Bacteroidota bacterium]HET6243035.1 hypothetical protein [Bacteroidia bacterium]